MIYGYTRVSTLSQLELSPEQQRHEIAAFVDRHGIAGELVFLSDDGVSGMSVDQRPSYQRLLTSVKNGDTVIVFDLSRLGRRAKEVLSALDTFRERNVRFVSIRQNLDSSTIAGSLVYGILAVVGEMLVMESRQRTKAALDFKKSKHERLGGELPFGYDCPDGVKLVPNAAEFATLMLLARLRRDGWSYLAISRELEARGIRTKTGKTSWHANTVRKLFQRISKAGDGERIAQ